MFSPKGPSGVNSSRIITIIKQSGENLRISDRLLEYNEFFIELVY